MKKTVVNPVTLTSVLIATAAFACAAYPQSICWQNLPAPGPSARDYVAAAYDSARAMTVLFGGEDQGTALSDTWLFSNGGWIPGPSGPPARGGHAMAYDAKRGQVVMFSGGVSSTLRDTWVYDGQSQTWIDKTPQDPNSSPPARNYHAMVYDAFNEVVVIFGGTAGSTRLDDTWTWDGTSWTQVIPGGPSPSARRGHAMTFDARCGRVILFGGESPAIQSDTWEWDGVRWMQRSGSGPALAHHGLAYDSVRERVILFGGTDGNTYSGETWAWTGSVWALLADYGPPARATPMLVYDESAGRLVAFGGRDHTGSANLSDTWILPSTYCRADYNQDCFVDGLDYDQFMNDFESGFCR